MVQPIVDKPLLPARMARNFESRQITRGDPELELMPAQPDIRQSRFDQNAICLGAFFKGQLIGYIWFCFREYAEDEVRCTFLLRPENEAVFDFDLFVLPEHRMGFGFAGIWNAANEFLRKRGARFTFSRVTRFNLATRRAHRRLGAKVAARAIFLKLWGVELMFATIAPYVHLSIAKSQRVHLQLRPDVLLS
ncbi:MAG: GNAT family N-acetyltransferase [Gammaproteobacteria bacterium]